MKHYSDFTPYHTTVGEKSSFTGFGKDVRDILIADLVPKTEEEKRLYPGEYSDNWKLKHPFIAVIRDVKTGKDHTARQSWLALSEDELMWDHEQQTFVDVWTLSCYFYAQHWCGCHRICDIEDANEGLVLPENDHCPDFRFFVLSCTHPLVPDVNFFTEAMNL
jgi:hypothetical protein